MRKREKFQRRRKKETRSGKMKLNGQNNVRVVKIEAKRVCEGKIFAHPNRRRGGKFDFWRVFGLT
jgi:hypothetical protein